MGKLIRIIFFGPISCLFGVLALICFYGLMGREGTMKFLTQFIEDTTDDN